MKKILVSATSVMALCAFATISSAAPLTGDGNREKAEDGKGPNGSYASSEKSGMGSHASDGKGGRTER